MHHINLVSPRPSRVLSRRFRFGTIGLERLNIHFSWSRVQGQGLTCQFSTPLFEVVVGARPGTQYRPTWNI